MIDSSIPKNILALATPFGTKLFCKRCRAESFVDDYSMMTATRIEFNHQCNVLGTKPEQPKQIESSSEKGQQP